MESDDWTSISTDIPMTTSSDYPSYPKPSNISDVAEPMPFNVVTAVVYSIVFIVGLVGNTLVTYVVIRDSNIKMVTNIYILNLALADGLYILGIPFLGTNSVLSYWPYGDFFCKVCMTADAMSQFASIFCLTVMSIDRYLAVVHPISSSKWRTPRMAKSFNVGVWVLSFLVVLPVTIYSHVQEEFNTCNITWPEPQGLWSIVFILYTTIVGFFGPLVIISFCYLLIVIKVRTTSVRAGRLERRRSELKVNRMVVIIVLVFVICWLPFYTTNIVNLIHIIPENNTTIYFFLVILTYVNSCANPFLYGFLSENFRQSFQKVLGLHKRRWADAVMQMRGRQSPPQENHNSIFTPRNHALNGQIQSIQQPVQLGAVINMDREPLTSKAEVTGHVFEFSR